MSELDRRSDSVFQSEGSGKRSEVKANLTDAQKLLVLISDSRKQLAQSSADLLRELEQTFAPPPASPPAPEVEEPKPKAKKRSSPRRAAPAPKQPSSQAAPAPAPKPPAPKPAAPKPDFEP